MRTAQPSCLILLFCGLFVSIHLILNRSSISNSSRARFDTVSIFKAIVIYPIEFKIPFVFSNTSFRSASFGRPVISPNRPTKL